MNKAAQSSFETQRRRHRKSETGVSVAQQKEHVSNNLLKNIDALLMDNTCDAKAVGVNSSSHTLINQVFNIDGT